MTAPPTAPPEPPGPPAPLVEELRPRPWYRQPAKVILSAGALAGALGSILTFGGMVGSLFADDPEGTVTRVEIQDLTPITYKGWIAYDGGNPQRVPEDQADLPGRLVTYAVETEGFADDTELPVRIILHDLTTGRVANRQADSLRVGHGATCGCADFVLVPHRDHRYRLELQVYAPGGVEAGASPERLDFRAFGPA